MSEKTKDKRNSVVTKSNSLIEARYKLSVEEQRVVLFLVSLIKTNDEDFKIYEISVKDFSILIESKSKNMYKQFMLIGESLTSKTISIKKEGSTLVMSWLSSAEYLEKQGKIELSFDPKLKPYLLKLKSNFTTYKLENIIRLKSTYSIRIYELLKQYERVNERTFTIDQIRTYLCIDDKQYPLYANFKQKVLRVAQLELEAKSDIWFEMTEIKNARKVEKVKFIIHQNKKENISASVVNVLVCEKSITSVDMDDGKRERMIESLKLFVKEDISQKDFYAILDAAQENIELIRDRYKIAKEKKEVDNIVGFLIWACKQSDEQFKKVKSKGRNKFNNFEGRNWDYEQILMLEREALEEAVKSKETK